jgi:hypothetical protein
MAGISVFFQFSHVAPKVANQQQEDLAKSGYKINREEKQSRNLIACWQITRTY